MGLSCGLVGLPNAGKSTLFNALTAGATPVGNYPFTTTKPHAGVAAVPDPRLERLGQCIPHDERIPAIIEIVDLAGLVEGAHRGEGLGNEFLSHVLSVDLIIHVVRAFEDPTVTLATSRLDPVHDAELILHELLLKDLELVERWLAAHHKEAQQRSDRVWRERLSAVGAAQAGLNAGRAVRALDDETRRRLREGGIQLLTAKPHCYVLNVDEAKLLQPDASLQGIEAALAKDGTPVLRVAAKLEAELSQLSPEEQAAMRGEYHLAASTLERLVRTAYDLLGLVTFYTTDSRKLRAWSVPSATPAPRAAGTIHSDFERGFIRAEVARIADLEACGSFAAAHQQGKVRTEGKDYVVADGDVMHFRFQH